jgi:hypothetical protein
MFEVNKVQQYLESEASDAYINTIIKALQKHFVQNLAILTLAEKKEFLKTHVAELVDLLRRAKCPKPPNYDEFCSNQVDASNPHVGEMIVQKRNVQKRMHVDVHGVWNDTKLILPSRSAFDALFAIRDMVKSECLSSIYWNPEEVYKRMKAIGNMQHLTQNDVDGMLYQKGESLYLYESTKGPFRVYNPKIDAWISIMITDVKKYAKGFTAITALDLKTKNAIIVPTNPTMLYSIAI